MNIIKCQAHLTQAWKSTESSSGVALQFQNPLGVRWRIDVVAFLSFFLHWFQVLAVRSSAMGMQEVLPA